MRVNPGPGVVGEIEARIVRIFIDHDRIGIPEPVSYVGVVVGRDAKVSASEPEAGWTAALEPKYMARTETQRKASMFPGMVQMVAPLVADHIVAHPLAIVVHVGRIGMSLLVAKIWLAPGALIRSLPLFGWPLLLDGSLLGLPLFGSPLRWSRLPCSRSWTAGWNISTADVALIPLVAPAVATASLLPPRSRSCATLGIARLTESNARSTMFFFICASIWLDARDGRIISVLSDCNYSTCRLEQPPARHAPWNA